MCGLQDYADAIVGSLGVEHRKRTTIGVELAAKVYHSNFSRTTRVDTVLADTASVLG